MQGIRRFASSSDCFVIPPYFFFPPLHCSTRSAKYFSGPSSQPRCLSRFGEYEVCNLVVPSLGVSLPLQVLLRIHIMNVAAIEQQVVHLMSRDRKPLSPAFTCAAWYARKNALFTDDVSSWSGPRFDQKFSDSSDLMTASQ
jgi:hypothetical protein